MGWLINSHFIIYNHKNQDQSLDKSSINAIILFRFVIKFML